jgi:hypothetical protein
MFSFLDSVELPDVDINTVPLVMPSRQTSVPKGGYKLQTTDEDIVFAIFTFRKLMQCETWTLQQKGSITQETAC